MLSCATLRRMSVWEVSMRTCVSMRSEEFNKTRPIEDTTAPSVRLTSHLQHSETILFQKIHIILLNMWSMSELVWSYLCSPNITKPSLHCRFHINILHALDKEKVKTIKEIIWAQKQNTSESVNPHLAHLQWWQWGDRQLTLVMCTGRGNPYGFLPGV